MADLSSQQVDHAQDELAKRALGQRKINTIWEVTQAFIAITVTVAVLFASVKITLKSDMDKTGFIFLTNILFVIIGFYFGRTNHQKIGGIGGMEDSGR